MSSVNVGYFGENEPVITSEQVTFNYEIASPAGDQRVNLVSRHMIACKRPEATLVQMSATPAAGSSLSSFSEKYYFHFNQ